MSNIRVTPSSIHAYVTKTNANMAQIQQAMRAMMTTARSLNYEGQFGAEFKTDVGQISAHFVTGINHQLDAMTAAVNQSTANIAASLGGAPATVKFSPAPLTGEAVTATGDLYDVNIDQLAGFKATLAGHIDEVRVGLTAHRRALEETDWQGQAKQGAIAAVTAMTAKATNLCDQTQTHLQARVEHQIQATTAADQVLIATTGNGS